MTASLATIDRGRLAALIAREREAYAQRHPASRKAFEADGAAICSAACR